MPHLIAAAAYNGLLAFEYSIARELLGRDRRDLDDEWYDFRLCRVERGRLSSSHGLGIRPEGTADELASADTVLVAGWRETLERPSESFLEALREAHDNGARIVTICTGVFPLAYAGLLDGRRATTHWMHAPTLRESFPRIDVDEDALYIHDDEGPGRISTSAGCAAGLDLCLSVIREDFGLAIANTVARRMVAPVHREGGQSQYVEAPAGTFQDDNFGPMLDWMIEHIDESVPVGDVAQRFGFSLRTFQRRFKNVTGLTPHQWLIQQRVNRARELLESSDKSIEQVATLSGLGSAANLRKHLAQHLGTTPRAYRSAFRAAN